MNPETMFAECMKGTIRDMVKGGLIYQYMINPFSVWCQKFAPNDERDPESAYMNLIFQHGRDHEDEVSEEQFPGATIIDPTKHDAAFKETLEALFRGDQYISNGILYYLPEKFVAVPDVMVKRPGKSVFGDWHYEIVEVKSSKQIRPEHILQACYYNHLIGMLQKFTPKEVIMIGGSKEQEHCLFEDYRARLFEVIAGIRSIFEGKSVAPSKAGWPWSSYSLKRLDELKSISLIPSLYSGHREILESAGIDTLEDFFTLNILKVHGISPQTLERYRLSAKAILQGKHVFINKPFLPEKETELFMDFEGVDSVHVNGKKITGDYLIGVLAREDQEERFHAFVAEDLENEHTMLLSFLKFLKEKKSFTIYHYGSYEKSHLIKLLLKYHVDDEFTKQIINSMIDIHATAKKSVIFPTTSYTLKALAGYLGFSWAEIGDAKDSIVLYQEFLKKNDKTALDKIIRYNQDDCIALRKVKDFLVWGA